MSPGPISTREPSCVSINQRPDNGTTHCGRRTLVPLAHPAHGQDHEHDSRYLVRDLSLPLGSRLAADALHLEPAERTAREAAGAVRPGPQAVVRHLRSIIHVVSFAAHGPQGWERHRHVSKLSDEIDM